MKTASGILIVNSFLKSNQTDEIYSWLLEAGHRANIDLTLKTNGDYIADIASNAIIPNIPECDFVLFWNKDVFLGRALEEHGLRLFNSSEAIRLCDNKALTHEALKGVVKMPKTFKIPMTFKGIYYTNFDFLPILEDNLGYPFVIKECFGSYGGQVYLAHNRTEAVEILKKTDAVDCIAQEYIEKSKGRDLRVYVVGGQVVAAMERNNPNDFRANIANGGLSLPYQITDEQAEMAIVATKALGLDFGGVDLMFMDNDEPILCEVNSNAQFKGLFDATGINIADHIIEHIVSTI